MDIISFLLGLLLIINYQLALAFIGASYNFKDTIIPSLILAIAAYFSKIVFAAPPIIHTTILVIITVVLIHYLNKISLILSAVGSLLSFITLVVGSLLLVCPCLLKMGLEIPLETSGFQWIILNLAEFFVPLLTLLIFKIFKITPIYKLIN